jgi:hypothetical protein
MIVIIAGMPRSGSTFSFNVVRELLLARGTAAWLSDNTLPPPEEMSRTDHFILKSHNPDPHVLGLIETGEAKAICTFRKPEDAVASWATAFGFSVAESVGMVRSWLEWHAPRRRCTHNIDYEQIEGDPMLAIESIAGYLLGKVDAEEAHRLLGVYNKNSVFDRVTEMERSGTVDIGFSYYDPKSFFHRRHVRSLETATASETMSAEELLQVRQAFESFTDPSGLYVPA